MLRRKLLKRKHTRCKRRAVKQKKPTKANLAKKVRAAGRRALKEWADKIRAVGKCAVCGVGVVPKLNKDGTPKLNKRGKPILIHLHCHHVLCKERFKQYRTCPVNGVVLCPEHHKYGAWSAHRNPVWFSEWLRKYRPVVFRWVLAHMGREI